MENCNNCKNQEICKYKETTEGYRKHLEAVDSSGTYGRLMFKCDYYVENKPTIWHSQCTTDCYHNK